MKCAMRCGDPAGEVEPQNTYAKIDATDPVKRILTWVPEHSTGVYYKIMVDQIEHKVCSTTTLPNCPQTARDWLEVIEVSTQNKDEDLTGVAHSPLDRVTAIWSEIAGADRYGLYRSQVSGSYTDDPIYSPDAGRSSYSYIDGPLADGTYYFRTTVYDAADNAANSNEETEIIASAPDPPTGLAVSVSGGTLTLTWTASVSADVGHYHIYRGNPIELTAAPHATDVASPWSEDVSALTGHYEYLVRTEDASGNEENNLSQMVAVDLVAGVWTKRPNSPSIINGTAIAAGQVRVTGKYIHTKADAIATTIRLYVNNGAGGAVDYNTVKGTAALVLNAGWETFSVDSAGLSGGLTYICAIRAATSGSVEDLNTDTVSVTTDSTAPSAPTITTSLT